MEGCTKKNIEGCFFKPAQKRTKPDIGGALGQAHYIYIKSFCIDNCGWDQKYVFGVLKWSYDLCGP